MASTDYEITDHIKFFSDARFAQSKTHDVPRWNECELRLGSDGSVQRGTRQPRSIPTLNYAGSGRRRGGDGESGLPTRNAGSERGHGVAGAAHPVPVNMAILLNSRSAPADPAECGGRFNPLTALAWVLETYPAEQLRPSRDDRRSRYVADRDGASASTCRSRTGPVRCTTHAASPRPTTSPKATTRWRAGAAWCRRPTTVADAKHQQRERRGCEPELRLRWACLARRGFYETIFNGDTRPSDDCIYAVQASLQTRTENQQDVVELNFQGGLVQPAGWRAARGVRLPVPS